MLLEMFVFFGLITSLLVLFAEIGHHPPLGIVAGIILLFMAYTIIIEGIQTTPEQVIITNSTYTNWTNTSAFSPQPYYGGSDYQEVLM